MRNFARKALEGMQLGERSLSRSKYPLQEVAAGEAMRLFQAMDFDKDRCEDAGLIGFAHYLRGCKGLVIPERWKPLIPTRL